MKKALFILSVCLGTYMYAQNTLPATGNVGIGTTTPTAELEVKGTTELEEVKVKEAAEFEKEVMLKDDVEIEKELIVDQNIQVKGDAEFNGDVKTDGDIKVLGTTELDGDAFVEGQFGLNGYKDISIQDDRFLMIKPNGAIEVLDKSGFLNVVYGSGSFCAPLPNGFYPAPMWEKADGNPGKLYTAFDCPSVVGIGTENPVAKLHVEGKTLLVQDSPQANALEVRYTPNGTTSGIGINTIVNNNNTIAFNVNNVNSGDVFTISGSGDLFTEGQVVIDADNGNNLLLKSGSGTATIGFQSSGTEQSRINYFDQYGVIKGSYSHNVESAKSTFTWSDFDNSGVETELMKLSHDGVLYTHEIKVITGVFPDYVFEKDYELMSIEELEKYISANGHLPNMPTESEVLENGLAVGELEVKLVEKIEELTLYIIELEKKYELLEQKLDK